MVVPWSESGDPDTTACLGAGSVLLLNPGVMAMRDKRMLGDNKYQKGISKNAPSSEGALGII
ncbi:hypothetical protein [Enterobacter sp. Bisph1]|uniref:hypothetical protein n=1 Tax=Enterobacter sp. Bisph1 TaxID=1274399 RepID=UPI00057C1177|nr:hypothetical protein [Enterobacter sp. Bisph1]